MRATSSKGSAPKVTPTGETTRSWAVRCTNPSNLKVLGHICIPCPCIDGCSGSMDFKHSSRYPFRGSYWPGIRSQEPSEIRARQGPWSSNPKAFLAGSIGVTVHRRHWPEKAVDMNVVSRCGFKSVSEYCMFTVASFAGIPQSRSGEYARDHCDTSECPNPLSLPTGQLRSRYLCNLWQRVGRLLTDHRSGPTPTVHYLSAILSPHAS